MGTDSGQIETAAKRAYVSIEEIGEGSLVCDPSFLVKLHGGGGTSFL